MSKINVFVKMWSFLLLLLIFPFSHATLGIIQQLDKQAGQINSLNSSVDSINSSVDSLNTDVANLNTIIESIITGSGFILSGDVVGSSTANVVELVGGQSAVDIAAATIVVNNATPFDTPDTIVLRDASGNFDVNMITIGGAVLNPTDVATKQYVDSIAEIGFQVLNPVIVTSLTDVVINGLTTIDGVSLIANDRVLLVGQSNPIQNGIWLAEAGAWTRPLDFASGSTAETAYVLTISGATQLGTGWVCSTPLAIIDTDPIAFTLFSLPNNTTAANVGTGIGQLFRDKTEQTLNFKTISAGSHIGVTNLANEVSLATDATSLNIPGTSVARDGLGNFDISQIRFKDSGANYVGLLAPTTVPSSYSIALPAYAPSVGQALFATSAATTTWRSVDSPPAVAKTYYVSLAGNDANDGSQTNPFRTIANAVSVANGVASLSYPVAISIGAGVFTEDNSGGAIAITADGITVIGVSQSTLIMPTTLSNDLFSVTAANVEFAHLQLQGGFGSTANAINQTISSYGRCYFTDLAISMFQGGIISSASGIPPTIFYNSVGCAGCGTCISAANLSAIIQSSVFRGPLFGGPANNAIIISGASGSMQIFGSYFSLYNTAFSVSGGAALEVLGCHVDNTVQGLVCSGASKASLTGCNFLQNLSTTVNASVSGVGSMLYVNGCIFDCEDASQTPQGTAIQVISGAKAIVDSSFIEDAAVGIQIGILGDTSSTKLKAVSVGLVDCTSDIQQIGTSTLQFVGGTFEIAKVSIADPTNVSMSAFYTDEVANFAVGSGIDIDQVIFQIMNGQPLTQHVSYQSNYYGYKGQLYENPNANPTFNGVQAQSNDAASFVVTGDRTKAASVNLISDAGNFGVGDFVRGWAMTKNGNQADLAFTYSNNDTSGLAARGANAVLNLNGFDNQVEFPAAANLPLPTNSVAKLVWAGDTNLYRASTNTLKTDSNMAIGTLTPAGVVHNDATGLLTSSLITNSDISASAAITDDKLATISTAGKVANSATTATSADNANTIVLRDASGNFSAGSITGNLMGNATTAISFTGPLLGDVTGTQGATVVSLVAGQSAASVAAATIAANGATALNTPNTIVKRDSSGNFTANMISLLGTVVNPTDVTTKAYVDAVAGSGFTIKQSVLVTSLTNVSLTGIQTIDGILLSANDRVLLVGQTNPVENGIWLAESGVWVRPLDFASGTTVGTAYILTTSGYTEIGSGWVCTTPTAIINTNPISFTIFSLPDQTTGANVGTGAGQVYRDKTGQTLNFKTIAAGTHMTVTNNANDVTVATDASYSAVPNTIVARDASGNFSANNIAASLTGSASLNVLKTGDTMSGALTMSAQTPINFADNTSGNYVGLQAPTTIGSSYMVSLPSSAPTSGQVLQATSASAMQWATMGGSPTVAKTYYVALNGSDSNDGSFGSPFRTISHTVSVANAVAGQLNPIAIQVGSGIFVEDNTGGPISITADGISLFGSSPLSTYIIPMSIADDLFYITGSLAYVAKMTLMTTTSVSTAAAVTLAIGATPGNAIFDSLVVRQFQTGFALSSVGGAPAVVMNNLSCLGNGTNIAINNIAVDIKNSIFIGPETFGMPISNNGISITGTNSLVGLFSCAFVSFNTGISITGGSPTRILGCDFENVINGIIGSGASNTAIDGCNFLANVPSSVNVAVAGANTNLGITGCTFNCTDTSGIPQGIALMASTQANLLATACSIVGANIGIQCGTTGDTVTTVVKATSVGLESSVVDINQVGSSKLHFVGGTFEAAKILINDPTNVSFAAFDSNGEAILAIGNATDNVHAIYRIENGQILPPNLTYNPNYYGYKGTVYLNPNANPTFNGVQAQSNDAASFVVTGDRTKAASVNLISDTGNFGVGDFVRGWAMTKNGNQADLSFTYSNNDTSGLAARGANAVLNLNGFDNQVEFPAAANLPLPTNSVAKLVWAGDTNLYRASANTLKTDSNMAIGTLTPAGVVHNDATGLLTSSLITNSDISASAAIADDKLATISTAGKVANSATTATSADNANTIVLRDGSGNFSAGSITANLNGNATTAATAINFTGSLSGDVTGTQGATVVSLVSGQNAASVAAATMAANAATALNTPSTIVKRDVSGDFATNMITIDGTVLNPTDVTTKAYVDAAIAGVFTVHDPVFVTSLTNISLVGTQTIDGNFITPNTRVLLVNQTNPIENGIWLCEVSTWSRPVDFAAGTTAGIAYVLTMTGTVQAGSGWVCATPDAIINVDPISFVPFSLVGQAIGANVGSGTGTIYRDKTGRTLNFKTIANANHINITNNTNDVTIATDATNSTVANTIVARDASGNFSANNITASLTGSASLNVLKTGDTMSGALTMSAQTPINFADNTSGNYVGLQAPTAIGSSYMVSLPSSAPTSGQVLQATSASAMQWATMGGSPTVAKTYNVALNGSDSNDGSFGSPFRTIKYALSVANGVASLFNPVEIRVGSGIFVEDNSGGPLSWTADGISLGGTNIVSTVVIPTTLSNDLLHITTSNYSLFWMTLSTGGGVSTAAGLNMVAGDGQGGFQSILFQGFKVGCSLNGSGGIPNLLIADAIALGNETAMEINNIRVIVTATAFRGSLMGDTPSNAAITVTGSDALATLIGNSFRLQTSGISTDGGARTRILSSSFESSDNGVVSQGNSFTVIDGCSFVDSNSSTVNVLSTGAGTQIVLDGCQFKCTDTNGVPQGTALKATEQGSLLVTACSISSANTAIQCGTAGDTVTTVIKCIGLGLDSCITDIEQVGTSKLYFVGGTFSASKVNISDPTNVSFGAFDTNGEAVLAIGNATDSVHPIYRVENGQATPPNLTYNPNYYGYKGTVYLSQNSEPTFNATQSPSNTVAYYLVTGDRSQEASFNMISDAGNLGNGDFVRGWSMTKTSTNADLAFTYSNNDTVGLSARGANTVMNLNGFDNQVEFPAATDTPLPTNAVAKLVWAGDTNLYRASANTLMTDSNMAIGTLTPAGIVHNDATGLLTSSLITNSDINATAGITDDKLATISTAGKVANSATTATSADNANTIVLRDASGNFSAGSITGNLMGNATTAISFTGPLLGDITGTQGATVVSLVGGQSAVNVAAATVLANAATSTNLANTIVRRDASGNFSAGTISANLLGSATFATIATNFSGSLAGDVTGNQNATVVSTVGGQTAASLAAAATAVANSTPTNTINTLVKRDGSGNFSANAIVSNLTGNVTGNLFGNATTAITANSATNFTGSLAGDVVGTQGSTVVNTVGGQTAANVAAGVVLANAATSNNTASTIVRRDASGGFNAGVIAGSLVGNVTGNLFGQATTATSALTANSATTFTGPLVGDVTGSQSATVVSLVGGQSAANVAAATSAVQTATSNNVANTLVIRDSLGNFKTNMISLAGTVANSTDAATKEYVDAAVASGFTVHNPVLVTSLTNVSLVGTQTIDGVLLSANDRVLLVGQTDPIENGLWLAEAGTWTRPLDFAVGTTAGSAYVLTTSGGVLAGSGWVCSTPTAIVGINSISFAEFSLPGQTTVANVGSGAGQLFRDKTGQTLNFKTIAAGTHMVVTNNANDVSLATDATSANTPSSIIARDASGNFSAGIMTGSASNNVLKSGDTMTGNLNMASQSQVRFEDASSIGYVGIDAPTTVPSSYSIALPASAPTPGQVLQALSVSATRWATIGGAPSISETYYVSLDGNDSNDGSYAAPFRTVKHAVSVANGGASLSTPIAIVIGAGIFTEDNSGGPITVTADGISILGSSQASTTIVPSTLSTDLFNITTSNVEIAHLGLQGGFGSTANAIMQTTIGYGRCYYIDLSISIFQTGFSISSTGIPPAIFIEDIGCAGNGTCIFLSNATVLLQNSVFRGPLGGPATNTGIVVTGSSGSIDIFSSYFSLYDTAVSISGSATMRITGCTFEGVINGMVCAGASTSNLTGLTFTLNSASSIDVLASQAGTEVYIVGSQFNGADTLGNPQGTAVLATTGASLVLDSSTIEKVLVGIQTGTTGDTSSTSIRTASVSLVQCSTDIVQVGSSSLQFVGGTFEATKIVIADSTNVSFSAFNCDGKATLAIGDNSDMVHALYQILNGQPSLQNLTYNPNYYGNKGTVYQNANADPTFNATQAQSNDAAYYVVTGDRTKAASVNLISDAGSFGVGDFVRGWAMTKTSTQADLAFTYSNNDTSGLAARGANTVINLNGFDNQVEFPTATNVPLPTNTVAKLVWAGDTNLYRDSANTLKTDSNMAIGALTLAGVVHNDATGLLTSSLITNTDISATAGITDDKLATISTAGKVANSATSATSTNDPSTIVLRDASGNFSAGTITANVLGNATSATNFTGPLLGDVTGFQGATVVSTIGGQSAANVAAAAALANAATSSDIANAIVRRDAFGNFNAGTISANLLGSATFATTATNFSGSLVGDVTGTQGATVVSTVGGQTAASVASTVNTVGNATPTNTPSTLVQRDSSGNFSANAIASNLTGNVTGNLYGNATTATTANSATNFTGSLVGDVSGTQGATVLNFVGSQSATNVAAATVLTTAATANNTASTIVRRDASGSFSAGIITASLVGNVTGNLFGQATTATTATNFSGSLSGDVTGNQGSTVVATVGGQSAANVAAATLLANAATSTNTANTIVRRDASGNFSANAIASNLTGNVTGNLFGQATTATTATNFSGSLSGDVTGNQGSTVVATVGGQSAANVAAATVSANAATSTNTANTIVRRDASGNFSANAIASNLTGNVTGNLFGQATTATTATNFSGSLSGDVTGNQGSTVVATVGGQSAANVAAATVSANAATSTNTANTIVRRDASGNFSANAIASNLTGNVTGNLFGQATTATTATNFSGSLVGDVTGTQGATVVSMVGGQTATSVASTVNTVGNATPTNTPSTLVQRDSSGNFRANAIASNLTGNVTGNLYGNATTATTANSATNFTGSLVGDVSGTQGATVVSTVGGQSATNVAAATVLTNAATANNTASTIVRRDASGSFSAGIITASLVGNVTGNLFGQATTATTATNFSGSLSGDVTGNQGSTVVATVGGQSAANVAAATLLANAAISTNTANTIVRRDASGNFSANAIASNLTGNVTGNLFGQATTATTATNFSGSLSGDVTGNQGSTVVATVGGQSAANIAAATVSANAATSTNTANTIVRRDASGNFSANAIASNLTGNVTGNLFGQATTATTATNFSGSLSGDVTGNQGSTVVATVGGQSAANVAAATVSANAATSTNTANTIVRRDASGNFSANAIASNLTGNVTGNLFGQATTATTATNFSGSLVGDVTGTQGATVVSTVGGKTATSVASTVNTVGNATPTNTPSTLVQRDSSGNFSANAIASNLTGNVTGNLYGNATTATTANSATNFTGSLVGDVSGTQGATVVSTVGGQTATNVAAATVLANAATANNTASAIVRRDASGNFSAGTITAALIGAASLNVLKAGDTMTGTLTMPAGSAASPSIQFTGSTQTGIAAPTANQLSFVTSGAERLTISDSVITTAAVLAMTQVYCNQAMVILPVGTNTITVNNNTSVILKKYNGATMLTVVFPASPTDGQMLTIIAISQTAGYNLYVTTVGANFAAVSGRITLLNPGNNFSSTAAGASVTYIYNATDNVWYRYARG